MTRRLLLILAALAALTLAVCGWLTYTIKEL
jgi:outer membrane lipopolysaccharide assembly protein LptE/RlpB